MSAEEVVTEALNQPIDQNAQAAEDAKKMLAELQADAGSEEKAEPESNGDKTTTDDKVEATSETKQESTDRPRERRNDRNDRNGQRGGRGGRGSGRGGRGGYGDKKNFRENIKSDLTSQEVSDDPVAIRKQVEFYFSDSNLPMDKFLLGKVGGSKNNPVEISILHSFKRMRHFQPFDAIVEALKDSKILELTDDNTCVRRKEPLPEALNDGPDPEAVQIFEDKAMPRSVYVKGFGEELPSTQFDVEAFFAPYGPTNAIRLRRTDDKIFKRSVFVEFETEELATKFLELDPKPKYKGKDLLIMSKKAYCDQKIEDIKSGKIKPNGQRGRGSGRKSDGRGGRDSKRKRDDGDDRDWRERRDEDRKNGFKDDNRRGGRSERDRDSRRSGGRDNRERKTDTDERGVPVVKTTNDAEEKAKRDAAKAEALARARAVVEEQNKKSKQDVADDIEATEQEGSKDTEPASGNIVADSIAADVEASTKKRGREDDEGDIEREVKKTDTKVEA